MFVLSMLIASVIVREGDSVPERTGGFEAVEMDVILEVCVFNLGQYFPYMFFIRIPRFVAHTILQRRVHQPSVDAPVLAIG